MAFRKAVFYGKWRCESDLFPAISPQHLIGAMLNPESPYGLSGFNMRSL
jgi:hypothetical protein